MGEIKKGQGRCARIMARRRVILREESAMKIQGAWRVFLARKKVEHKRLERAVLRVQCAWRARSGRLAYHLKKQAKIQIEKEEAEAASKLQSLYRGRAARLRIQEHKEQTHIFYRNSISHLVLCF